MSNSDNNDNSLIKNNGKGVETAGAEGGGSEGSSDPYAKSSYRQYVLGILTTTYVFNFVDRQILSILQEPIKAELGLSDTQLGLLTGFAFAVFYITMGLPIARWADTGVRRSIIAFSLGLWSLMTALSGMAQNFFHLLLARMGVGVGEAGATPPAHSMISDIFPPERRVTAIAVYNTGVNIGMLAGFLIGGWVLEAFGWRAALFTVGLPGILLAIIIRLTVAEPKRRVPVNTDQAAAGPSLMATAKRLWQSKTYRYIAIAGAMSNFTSIGLFVWMPPFLSRSFQLGPGEIGTWLALSIGVGGAAGTYFSGAMTDKLGERDVRWYAWLPAAALSVSLPLVAATLLSGSSLVSLLFFLIPAALAAAYFAPLIAMTHSLVDDNMRAMSSAMTLLIINLIGLGLGPLCIGYVSDLLLDSHGAESLRQSMLLLLPLSFAISIVCYMLAAPHLARESRYANS
jgi:predicted MFS family arabinose efflux permease